MSLSVASEPGYTLNDEMMINELFGNWESLLTFKDVPDATKKNAANSAYGLMFQLWLIPKYRVNCLSKSQVSYVLNPTAIKLLDNEDPLGLKPFYKSGILDEDGVSKTEWMIIKNGDQIFKNEREYDSLVSKFLMWLAPFKGKN